MRFVQSSIFLYFFLALFGISGFVFTIIWPQSEGFYAFISMAAVGGLGVSLYIFSTKRSHKQLVCPVGSNCNVVVNSRYAKFLGVSLEYWGMLYYATIVTSYLTLLFAPHVLSDITVLGISLLTTFAFFFSLYLLFVQAFLLRQWCIWCLLSALFSILIFIISLASIESAVSFFAEATPILEALRALGFALGIGSITATAFLFKTFLSDRKIDQQEMQTLKGISELVLLSLVLVLISQFSFYITYTETLSQSPSFLIQTLSLFVAAISGAILMIIFTPMLTIISFKKTKKGSSVSLTDSLKKPLTIMAAIALSSWYVAFFMNYAPEYSFSMLASLYGIVVVATIVGALFLGRKYR
ncbi:MAG: vitamin K epoxide reductase family protein [bacterium]|nr:vitamin K epoxide reductase family protein [bacterium]